MFMKFCYLNIFSKSLSRKFEVYLKPYKNNDYYIISKQLFYTINVLPDDEPVSSETCRS